MYDKIFELATDTETVFDTDQAETYLKQRVIRGTERWNLMEIYHPDESTTTDLQEENQHRKGSKFGSTYGRDFYLCGLSPTDVLNSGATYTYPQANQAELLRRLMGASAGGIGTTTAGGSTASSIVLTSAAPFFEGGFFAVDVNGTGIYEVRRIVDITGSTAIPHMAFSAGPSAGRTVLNAEVFWFDEAGVGGDTNSLILRLLGAATGDQYICRGVGGTIKLMMEMNQLLKMGIDFKIASWSKVTGETMIATAYDDGGPLPVRLAEVQYATAQTTPVAASRNLLTGVESFNVDPGMGLEPQQGISAPNGDTVEAWRQMEADTMVTMTVRGHANYDQFYTDAAAQTNKSIGFQFGNTAGAGGTGMVYIHMPRCQWNSSPKRTEGGGFVKSTLEFQGMLDAATGLTTKQGRGKIYIATF